MERKKEINVCATLSTQRIKAKKQNEEKEDDRNLFPHQIP